MTTAERSSDFGFAAPHDAPIPYLQRIRDYYVALGYGAPYEWAHYAQVPFHRLAKPLAQARVTIVTTAAPYQPGKGDQGPGAPYNAAAKFYAVYSGDTAQDHDLRISHIAIDRKHTTAEDPGTYFPLPELRRAAERGRIGQSRRASTACPPTAATAPRWRSTAPSFSPAARPTRVDAALLVANCPVCHQSVSLCRAPAGGERHRHRGDGLRQGHRGIRRRAAPAVLRLPARQRRRASRATPPRRPPPWSWPSRCWKSAPAPRTTVQSPLVWSDEPDWKLDYSNIARLSPEEIARRRAEFDRQKAVAKTVRAETQRAQASSHSHPLTLCPQRA